MGAAVAMDALIKTCTLGQNSFLMVYSVWQDGKISITVDFHRLFSPTAFQTNSNEQYIIF
jgi:fatty-acid desaturase